MNNKIKFLELILSDLISERDSYEIDLTNIVNSNIGETTERKKQFQKTLSIIVECNNKIKTLSDYLANLTQTGSVEVADNLNNNND
tara:strand:- start:5115 stop:5372 length:258 start_codon:yes stop_codon:yes gene_type:complete